MLPVLSQQPYAVDTRNSRNSDHVRDILKINVVISLNESDTLHANGENIAQAAGQAIPYDRFFIHRQLRTLSSCIL